MKKRSIHKFAPAFMLFVLLVVYISGAILVTMGIGYFDATKKNPDVVVDYTQTDAFRNITGEYMDAFYKAVSEEEPLYLPYSDDIVYFAYGLDTNRVFCSDPNIFDMPSFDEAYMNSESYVYYLKYSSGVFRGNDKATGVVTEFEYSYTEAVGEIFNGEPRYYADAAIIMAVPAPKIGSAGYESARWEFYVLKNGIQISFIMLGIFLVSTAIMLTFDRNRKICEKLLAGICGWLFAEIKLGVLLVWAIAIAVNIIDGKQVAVLALSAFGGIPILYLACCEFRYNRESFFQTSIIAAVCDMVRNVFGTVAPVNDLKLRFRRRSAAFMIFGVVFPGALFTAVLIFLGDAALKFCLLIYFLLYTVLGLYVFSRYGRLVNGISKLTSVTSCFALGKRLPIIPRTKGDLEPLISHIRDFDTAVDAAADVKYKYAVKGFEKTSAGLEEMQNRLAELNERLKNSPDYDVYAPILAELNAKADGLRQNLVKEAPIAAPVFKRIDLLEVLDHVLDTKIAEFSAARIKVEFRFPEPPVYITADASHIAAALDVLLTNTAMYAVADTNVKIRLNRGETTWELTIENAISDYTEKTVKTSAISVGLINANEYISVNGGKMEVRSGHGVFVVTVVFPASR